MFNHSSAIPLPLPPRSAARELPAQARSFAMARFAVAALVIPEIPTLLWYAQTHSMLYFRGWINAEYLLLLCLGLLFPSWWTVALLTAELTIALVEPVAHLYYFSPQDALYSLRYLLLLPRHRLAEYACLFAIYLVVCVALLRATLGVRRLPQARNATCLVLALTLLPVVVDLANGRLYKFNIHIGRQPKDIDIRAPHLVRTPAASLIWAVQRDYSWKGSGQSKPLPSVLGSALAKLPVGDRPDIVLVLTESWGLANEDRITQAQRQPYQDPGIAALYHVDTGTVRFQGPTTSGETRELCGDAIGNASIAGPAGFYAACWTARLAAAGYHTLAVHGFTPTMFNRKAWYRRFGFEQTVFLPELQRDGTTMCDGAFPGACDADVAHWIGNALVAPRDPRPIFVHWVTLNSHLPVARLADGTSKEACTKAGIDQEEGLCSWFLHVLIVQHSVAELALKPGLRPTIFVIVGDHAPPFLRTDIRDRFSQTSVPYVVLMPRSIRSVETAALHPTASSPP